MKYPELISFSDSIKELRQFDCIIDVRSPSEFAEDHIPGAINCPVLNDAERILVGTTYKQVSAFEAKKIGAALVAKNVGTHLESLFLNQTKEWKPLIYCWRGGNRSGSMAHIFAKIGWPVAQLDGGYKGYRQYINQILPELAPQISWKVICGTTGSGKSRLLESLSAQGAQVLDLEKLANHRGSVLGKVPSSPQPSQKSFESAIWATLQSFNLSKTVFVESESKKVGDLRVPDAIMESMRRSPCIDLELNLESRIALLMEDYAHFTNDGKTLIEQLTCLVNLHGKDQILEWSNLIEDKKIPELVQNLLIKHYDPAYHRAIAKNFSQFKIAPKHILLSQNHGVVEQMAQQLITLENQT
jgi:tRNA 2-selenouridine synthase